MRVSSELHLRCIENGTPLSDRMIPREASRADFSMISLKCPTMTVDAWLNVTPPNMPPPPMLLRFRPPSARTILGSDPRMHVLQNDRSFHFYRITRPSALASGHDVPDTPSAISLRPQIQRSRQCTFPTFTAMKATLAIITWMISGHRSWTMTTQGIHRSNNQLRLHINWRRVHQQYTSRCVCKPTDIHTGSPRGPFRDEAKGYCLRFAASEWVLPRKASPAASGQGPAWSRPPQ